MLSITLKTVANGRAPGQAAKSIGTRFPGKRSVHDLIVKERDMGNLLYWAVVFLIVAIVAGVLGFGGIAGTAASGANLLFYIAIILFVVSLVAGLVRRG
jgi:uncharacterized membrane protein YtjA (UPF0391 family)